MCTNYVLRVIVCARCHQLCPVSRSSLPTPCFSLHTWHCWRRADPTAPRKEHALEEGDLALDLDDATADEVDELLSSWADKHGLQAVASTQRQATGRSFTETLMGAWDGFDMRAACQPACSQATDAAPAFRPAGGATDLSIDDIMNMAF